MVWRAVANCSRRVARHQETTVYTPTVVSHVDCTTSADVWVDWPWDIQGNARGAWAGGLGVKQRAASLDKNGGKLSRQTPAISINQSNLISILRQLCPNGIGGVYTDNAVEVLYCCGWFKDTVGCCRTLTVLLLVCAQSDNVFAQSIFLGFSFCSYYFNFCCVIIIYYFIMRTTA